MGDQPAGLSTELAVTMRPITCSKGALDEGLCDCAPCHIERLERAIEALTAAPAHMMTPLGLLPVNAEGMQAVVDALSHALRTAISEEELGRLRRDAARYRALVSERPGT